MGLFGVVMTGLCILFARPISRFFVGYSEELCALSVRALELVALSFLLGGITTYSSSYFTGLNEGGASLAIAAVKGFVGPLTAVWLLPMAIGENGLWLSPLLGEVLAVLCAAACFLWWRKHEAQKLREAAAGSGD